MFRRVFYLLLLVTLAGPLTACQKETMPPLEGTAMPDFLLTTSAFSDGETIPARFTCDGENKSPALSWSGLPQGVQSLALIADDPDAPVGTFTHWVIYNIAPTLEGLPEGLPQVAQPKKLAAQGMNNFRHTGYDGPCPPRGPVHRYFFKLYALDLPPTLEPGLTAQQLVKAIQGHILAQAQVIGRYSR